MSKIEAGWFFTENKANKQKTYMFPNSLGIII